MRNSKGQFEKKYNINENFYINKDKNFYYFLGLMASDGNVRNSKTFSISQSGENGKKLIEFIKEMIGSDNPIYHYKKVDCYTLSITSSEVIKELLLYNIVKNKTLIYELPANLDTKNFNYFLQGYIEGDGSVGVYDNGNGVKTAVVSIVGTENFISNVFDKLIVKGNVRKIKNCKNLYEIRFYGKKVLDLFYEIYSDVVYKSIKHYKLLEFVNNKTVGLKYKKYYKIKKEVINDIKNNISPSELSKKYNIPIKTIYTWKYRNT
jgi:hypothetical protein